mgnify:CR=1 FL=1
MEMTQTLNRIVTDMKYILEEMASGNFAIKTRAEESYVGEFEGVLLSIRKIAVSDHHVLSAALSGVKNRVTFRPSSRVVSIWKASQNPVCD